MNRDYDYYIAAARKAEGRSSMLWLAVNCFIRKTLEEQKRLGTRLDDVPAILLKAIGPEKKNEPTSLGNIRAAAKQIEDGDEFSVI